jgi:beta-glucuronidase
MLQRDKSRCGIIIWSLSNETATGIERNKVLLKMAGLCRSLDSTRLVSSAFDHFKYKGQKMIIDDSLAYALDVLATNKYMGWYMPWPAEPGNVTLESKFNKPIIMSEFGVEANFGIHGADDNANLWPEEYQEKVYRDNINMLSKIPFL